MNEGQIPFPAGFRLRVSAVATFERAVAVKPRHYGAAKTLRRARRAV